MSTLLSYGTLLLSRRKTVTAISPSAAVAGFALANVNDDVLGTISKLDGATGGWSFDLGSAQALHYIFVGNSNVSSGATTIKVEASNASDFSVLLLDVALTVTSPNFWKDLRSYAVSARYVRLRVVGNGFNLRAGEIVVGQVVSIPSFQWGYEAPVAYLEQNRGQTGYGGSFRRKHGVAVRGWTVRFAGIDTTLRQLWDTSRVAQTLGTPVIVIPDDTGTDAWYIDWPDPVMVQQALDNYGEFPQLTLQEQSPGYTA